MKRLHLKIYGDVHGVFFRAYVLEKATGLGLTGYVKNVSDGTVEAVAEGEENKLNELKDWCKKGPDFAKVKNVEEDWKDIKKTEYNSFEVIY